MKNKYESNFSKIGFLVEINGINYSINEGELGYGFIEETGIINELNVTKNYCSIGNLAVISNLYENNGYLIADQHVGETLHICCKYGDENKGTVDVIEGNYVINDSIAIKFNNLNRAFKEDLTKSLNEKSTVFKYFSNEVDERKSVIKVVKISIDYCLCVCLNLKYSSLSLEERNEIMMVKKIVYTTKLTEKEAVTFKRFFDKIYNCV